MASIKLYGPIKNTRTEQVMSSPAEQNTRSIPGSAAQRHRLARCHKTLRNKAATELAQHSCNNQRYALPGNSRALYLGVSTQGQACRPDIWERIIALKGKDSLSPAVTKPCFLCCMSQIEAGSWHLRPAPTRSLPTTKTCISRKVATQTDRSILEHCHYLCTLSLPPCLTTLFWRGLGYNV